MLKSIKKTNLLMMSSIILFMAFITIYLFRNCDFNETDKIEKIRFKNYLNSLILLVEDDSKIIGDHSLEGMKVLSVLKDYWY